MLADHAVADASIQEKGHRKEEDQRGEEVGQ